ncbi:nuclear transport factor 2 family protein [Flavobacterium sp. GP15]|uniref:nuclear transport factor 2 family protein n=1 Tax=Flavobacterium sp. GP15 TaxID=2758567 RepID=UPI00165DB8E4|nr:nuclear transport factor 2 family protein [Flavobacterium sp. GP15]
MKDREEIILNYLQGYNNFNVSTMVANFSDEITFENIDNGQISMTLHGIEAFKSQAETAKNYFSERHQIIKSFKHEEDKTEIEIEYFGVLAVDFPNGMKKGNELILKGKSIFVFKDKKIIKLTDIS